MAQCPKRECQGYDSHWVHYDAEAEVNVYDCENCGNEFEVPA